MWCTTKRTYATTTQWNNRNTVKSTHTSGLLMPIPNAIVAQITRNLPADHARWARYNTTTINTFISQQVVQDLLHGPERSMLHDRLVPAHRTFATTLKQPLHTTNQHCFSVLWNICINKYLFAIATRQTINNATARRRIHLSHKLGNICHHWTWFRSYLLFWFMI